jgi:hypothetical protein
MARNDNRLEQLAAVLRERFGDPVTAERERITPDTPPPPMPPRPTGRRRS